MPQLQTNWSSVFNNLLLTVQPGFLSLFTQPLDYYWSADETKWATDVMFTSPQSLANKRQISITAILAAQNASTKQLTELAV